MVAGSGLITEKQGRVRATLRMATPTVTLKRGIFTLVEVKELIAQRRKSFTASTNYASTRGPRRGFQRNAYGAVDNGRKWWYKISSEFSRPRIAKPGERNAATGMGNDGPSPEGRSFLRSTPRNLRQGLTARSGV